MSLSYFFCCHCFDWETSSGRNRREFKWQLLITSMTWIRPSVLCLHSGCLLLSWWIQYSTSVKIQCFPLPLSLSHTQTHTYCPYVVSEVKLNLSFNSKTPVVKYFCTGSMCINFTPASPQIQTTKLNRKVLATILLIKMSSHLWGFYAGKHNLMVEKCFQAQVKGHLQS